MSAPKYAVGDRVIVTGKRPRRAIVADVGCWFGWCTHRLRTEDDSVTYCIEGVLRPDPDGSSARFALGDKVMMIGKPSKRGVVSKIEELHGYYEYDVTKASGSILYCREMSLRRDPDGTLEGME